MTSQRETYGQAARERDLLRASVDLAVPKLVKARQLLAAPARDPRPHGRSRLMPARSATTSRSEP
jgi:hypothetical protein